MEKLAKFEFKSAVERGQEYNWDKILDGKIYKLAAGEDYKCKGTTFATLARTAAKRRGFKVKVSKVEGGMVVQRGAALPADEAAVAEEATA